MCIQNSAKGVTRSLSVMYLDGIKFGDYQVTITGMLMSVCFMCISRAKVSQSFFPCFACFAETPLSSAYREAIQATPLRQHLQLLRPTLGIGTVCYPHRFTRVHLAALRHS